MAGEKTSEQREADEAFEEALKNIIKVYTLLPEDCFMTEWLVLAEGIDMKDDNREASCQFMRGGKISSSKGLGMIRLADHFMTADLTRGDDDE